MRSKKKKMSWGQMAANWTVGSHLSQAISFISHTIYFFEGVNCLLNQFISFWQQQKKNCEKMNNKPHNNKGEEEKKKASKCLLFMPSRRQVRAEWVSEGIVDKIIKANNIKKFPRSGIFIGNVHRQRIAVWDTHRMHRIVTCRRCRFD